MKKIILAACLFCAVGAQAQKVELGVAGGPKLGNNGYVGSVGAYVKLWKLQVGAVCEAGNMEFKSRYMPVPKFLTVAPGANVNYIIPIKQGYVYPGVAARYTWGSNEVHHNLRGVELGVHTGITLKIVKSLYVNAEVGIRAQRATVDVSGAHTGNSQTLDSVVPWEQGATQFNVPALVGLRWAF